MLPINQPMRRLPRLDRSIDLLRPHPTTSLFSPFLCISCRRQPSFSTSIQRGAQKSSLPRTERLRRRIWGTDEPPGMEDPYGGPSLMEQRKATKIAEPGEEVKESHPELSAAAAPELDSSYEPATSWDGLIEVGGEKVEEFYFEGFTPAQGVLNTHEAVAAVHRAVVEVFSAKQSGRPFSDLSKIGRENDKTHAVEISGSPTAPVLQFKNGLSEESILDFTMDQEIQGEVDQVDESLSDRLEALTFIDYEKQVASWDPSWLQISLEDLELKFAIFKRVMQLTGIRIPDSAIESVRTVNSLLNRLTTPPKPAKLVEALAQKEKLINLPNVKIFGRRITPIDKQVSVGRWKLIEKELSRRRLPVTGY